MEINTVIVQDFTVTNNGALVLTLNDGTKIGLSLEEYVDKTLLKQPIKKVELGSSDPKVNDYILFNGKHYEYWTY